MRLRSFGPFLAAGSMLALSHPALAAEGWQVGKLSGHAWLGPERTEMTVGMPVSPGVQITTAPRSRLMLQRGAESIVIGPASVMAISEQPGEGLSTTVLERAGSVSFDVEKRNVRYFSVETPVLAAVVKGTHFTVSATGIAGKVAVARGSVEVTSLKTGQITTVTARQRANVDGHGLSVSGPGAHGAITQGKARASVVGLATGVATEAAEAAPADAVAAEAAVSNADHTSSSLAQGIARAFTTLVSPARAPAPAPGPAPAANPVVTASVPAVGPAPGPAQDQRPSPTLNPARQGPLAKNGAPEAAASGHARSTPSMQAPTARSATEAASASPGRSAGTSEPTSPAGKHNRGGDGSQARTGGGGPAGDGTGSGSGSSGGGMGGRAGAAGEGIGRGGGGGGRGGEGGAHGGPGARGGGGDGSSGNTGGPGSGGNGGRGAGRGGRGIGEGGHGGHGGGRGEGGRNR